jgi:hypothetical protein
MAAALDRVEDLLTGTGSGPWPLERSDYWTWDDGQDVWVFDEDVLRAAVETVAERITTGQLGDYPIYQAICDEIPADYSRIGSGRCTADELLTEVRILDGPDAAEELAQAIGEPWGLDSLQERMQDEDEGLGDWTSLPTYGGEAPEDTQRVWSWDAARMIVGTCADDVMIIPRPRKH